MIRVLHVITGLWVGGAESMLFRVLSAMDREEFDLRVISLTDAGHFGPKLEALGIPVTPLHMRKGPADLRALARLFRLVRAARPQVVQTWMYHSDLFGGLAARWAGAPVVWGIHQSNLSPEVNKRTTLALVRACAWLSGRVPARILCTAESAAHAHAAKGYAAGKMVVVPVGLDAKAFAPDPAARERQRREWSVPSDAVLIGMAARRDPQKDHETFFAAVSLLARERPAVRFVLCGKGLEAGNADVASLLDAAARERCRLLGPWDDMAGFYNALDIATLSSRGEGFPTVLGEAMLCGVPVAATDAGDAARIVGDTGRVVPARDPAALARAWRELIDMDREGRLRLGRAARERVREKYSLTSTVARYESLYRELAAGR